MESEKSRLSFKSDILPVLKDGAVGALVGVGAMLIATLLFAALLASGLVPSDLVSVFTVISAAVGALAGGLFAGLRRKRQGLFTGLSAGLFIFLILTAIKLCFSKSFGLDAEYFAVAAALIICGAIGGIIGSNIKSKNKNNRRYKK